MRDPRYTEGKPNLPTQNSRCVGKNQNFLYGFVEAVSSPVLGDETGTFAANQNCTD
jgi:hypothetical protein